MISAQTFLILAAIGGSVFGLQKATEGLKKVEHKIVRHFKHPKQVKQ